jgi:DNA repair exonuclease SbcCD ATPase subunit
MNIIERITKMENILDELTIVVEKSNKAMNELEGSLKDLKTLKKYYESQYMKDVMAERRNEVPQDLKRGVLSEDAVHMLLTDLVELSDKMEKLSKKIR